MSRHSSVVSGLSAGVVALLFGCALPRSTPPRPAQAPVPAAVAVTTPAPPAAPPPPPPLSVGPREDAPAPPRTEVAPPPPTEPPIPAGQRGRFVVLNFDNADVETVIHAASEIVGFNYVLAPDVRGKVTVQTSGRIPQEDVFGVLLAVLEVHGFTAIKSGNLYKIVRIEGARERAVPTIIGATPDPARTTDEVITQIVPLRYAAVTDVSTLLRPLISTRGNLIAHRETNILVVTDTASNIRRVLEIVRQVDVQVTLEEVQIIPLRYADAGQTAQVLTQLFQRGLRPSTPGIPGFPGPPVPAPPPALPSPGAPQAPGGQVGGTVERPPLIIAEPRSNSLIVNARRHEMETIRRLVSQLDINVGGGRRVFVYYAENAKAKDLAVTLNAIYGLPQAPSTATTAAPTPRAPGQPVPVTATPTPAYPGVPPGVGGPPAIPGDLTLAEGQVRFIADETTNAIIVTTLPRVYPEIEATIKQLDRMPRQVLIEVLVAEITLTDDTKLGIDWALREGKIVSGSVSGANTGTLPGTAGGTILSPQPGAGPSPSGFIPRPGFAGFGLGPIGMGLTAFTFDAGRFFAILNALASDNRVNIVSNPHVMTSENKKAVINVSTSVPVVTGQQTGTLSTPATTGGTTSTTQTTGSVNQAVEYKDAGVILTVTPRIGERGTVALDVKQEVNSVGPPTPPTNSPSFTKREAETSVVLLNNQTLVLGGLIQDKLTVTDQGIPLLKDIPFLGFLFGFKERKIEKTELLLLITPRVVGTPLDAARITEQMRKATPELENAMKRAPRAPSPTPTPPPPPPVAPPTAP